MKWRVTVTPSVKLRYDVIYLIHYYETSVLFSQLFALQNFGDYTYTFTFVSFWYEAFISSTLPSEWDLVTELLKGYTSLEPINIPDLQCCIWIQYAKSRFWFREGVFNRKMMMKTKICMKRIEDSQGGNQRNLSPSEVEGICNHRRGLLARMLACVPNTASEDTMVCWVLIMVTRIGLLSYNLHRT